MPRYVQLGSIPRKRHTQFRKPDGSLYREQVVGTKGFSGIQSILYHVHQPTQIKFAEKLGDAKVEYADYGALPGVQFVEPSQWIDFGPPVNGLCAEANGDAYDYYTGSYGGSAFWHFRTASAGAAPQLLDFYPGSGTLPAWLATYRECLQRRSGR